MGRQSYRLWQLIWVHSALLWVVVAVLGPPVCHVRSCHQMDPSPPLAELTAHLQPVAQVCRLSSLASQYVLRLHAWGYHLSKRYVKKISLFCLIPLIWFTFERGGISNAYNPPHLT